MKLRKNINTVVKKMMLNEIRIRADYFLLRQVILFEIISNYNYFEN